MFKLLTMNIILRTIIHYYTRLEVWSRQHTLKLALDNQLSKECSHILYNPDLKADRRKKVLLRILCTLLSFEIKQSLTEYYATENILLLTHHRRVVASLVS